MDPSSLILRVEAEMRDLLASPDPSLQPFTGMMSYHLGWLDQSLQPVDGVGGKRFRPLICLLACEAQGTECTPAVPAAAAIELLHNFSLIHDDIEDASPLRRHRETIWHLWGVPQAINAGDGMHVLAHVALHRLLDRGVAPAQVVAVTKVLDETSLQLCRGQYLDMAFEERMDITEQEYLVMIGGKTAALVSASTQIGAMLGTEDSSIAKAYRVFGKEMGLAFQMVDDILGIWGDPKVTGKSSASDILSKKKTLPLLHALARLEETDRAGYLELRRIYQQDRVEEHDVPAVLALLDQVGARAYVQAHAERHTGRAFSALERAGQPNAAGEELVELARSFLQRTH